MSYDLSVLWGWLIWALLIGLTVGWMTWRRESEGPWFVGGPRAAAVVFVVGLVVAALKLFPGRLGFWLESGLFFFATYVIGCLLGGWLRGTRERPSLAAAATAAGGAGVLTAQRRSEPAAPPLVKSPEVAQRPTPAAAAKVAETMSTAAKVAAAPQAPTSVPASSIARVPGNDLTRIRTITSEDQAKLNSLGVRSYADIAGWSSADQLTIEQKFGASGRAEREEWVKQARLLVERGGSRPDPLQVVAADATTSTALGGSVTAQSAGGAAKPSGDGVGPAAGDIAPAAGSATRAAKAVVSAGAATTQAIGDAAKVAAGVVSAAAAGLVAQTAGAAADVTKSATGNATAAAGNVTQAAGSATVAAKSAKSALGAGTSQAAGEAATAAVGGANAAAGHGAQAAGTAADATRSAASAGAVTAQAESDATKAATANATKIAAAGNGLSPSPIARGPEPARMTALEDEHSYEGARPVGYVAAPGGFADDLQRIRGIGPRNEAQLHALGVWRFRQIADWSHDNVLWVGSYLAFPGRIEREEWVRQARDFADGRTSEHNQTQSTGATSRATSMISGDPALITTRPPGLDAAAGAPDELTHIRGIDARSVGLLRANGIWHWRQIAGWTPENARWISNRMEAPDRVEREDWVQQAQILAAGGETTHSRTLLDAESAAKAFAETKTSASVDVGVHPSGLSAAQGDADDLMRIRGVDARAAGLLRAAGVWHWRQIASWTPENARWVSGRLGASGRVEREEWIRQAREMGEVAPAAGVVEPARIAKIEGEEKHQGARPVGYVAARSGKADDLQRIKGIGPQNETRLHALGIWHFRQIADWTHDEVLWVGSYLAFPGRIDREHWVEQAKQLA